MTFTSPRPAPALDHASAPCGLPPPALTARGLGSAPPPAWAAAAPSPRTPPRSLAPSALNLPPVTPGGPRTWRGSSSRWSKTEGGFSSRREEQRDSLPPPPPSPPFLSPFLPPSPVRLPPPPQPPCRRSNLPTLGIPSPPQGLAVVVDVPTQNGRVYPAGVTVSALAQYWRRRRSGNGENWAQGPSGDRNDGAPRGKPFALGESARGGGGERDAAPMPMGAPSLPPFLPPSLPPLFPPSLPPSLPPFLPPSLPPSLHSPFPHLNLPPPVPPPSSKGEFEHPPYDDRRRYCSVTHDAVSHSVVWCRWDGPRLTVLVELLLDRPKGREVLGLLQRGSLIGISVRTWASLVPLLPDHPSARCPMTGKPHPPGESVHPSVCLSIGLSIRSSVRPSIHRSIHTIHPTHTIRTLHSVRLPQAPNSSRATSRSSRSTLWGVPRSKGPSCDPSWAESFSPPPQALERFNPGLGVPCRRLTRCRQRRG